MSDRSATSGLLLALVLCVAAPGVANGQRHLTGIPDPDPELERQSFQVAEGFEVRLFAADPLIAKPIQMNFDSQGRLWVASSEVYPQIEPGQRASDKIIILEDRDRDGRADKTTVFADGLLIPTGVEPGDGGAYVANSTELVHLADTDGDGVADRRRILLSGFGTEDTHHILHTFRWGPDGMLYFNQSIYIHSHLETPHGVRRLNGGGIWQFRPETLQAEVFARGFVNPWGHHFDRWGQSFATDGAYGEGVNYVFPGATFVSSPGAKRILQGLNPGSPKHCGLEITSGRHLPDDWQGNVLTNDFRGHRVCRFVIEEDGSGYASREQVELIKTDHVAFRPVDIKMGPDGAIYIADWYNPIIQHGEVDFRDPRRDHTHGRIWRVTAKGRPLVEPPRLVGVPTPQLLEALKAPEDWTRHHARRQLKERGVEVLDELAAWVAALDPADPDWEHHRLEALWTYQALDVVEPELLVGLLRSLDHRARAAATRVLSWWHPRLSNPLELLATLVADDHPRVRLEAVGALARIRDPRAVELAMRALDRPVDRFLDYALWHAARTLEPAWLPALKTGDLDFGGRSHHLTFALESVGSPTVVKPLMTLLDRGQIPRGRRESVLSLIATLGSAEDLTTILDLAVAETTPARVRARLLDALAEAARRRRVRPAADPAVLGPLLGSPRDEVRAAAARLVGAWRVRSLAGDLEQLALDAAASAEVREGALEGLTRVDRLAAAEVCEQLAEGDSPRAVQLMALAAWVDVDVQAAARRAAELLAAWAEGDDPRPLFLAFLGRKNGPAALGAALVGAKLPPDVAKIGIRAARSTARDESELVSALTTAGGVRSGPTKLTPEEMEAMVQAVRSRGDARRGELVFRRADQACFKCHSISGAGGRVGPDLASIGASAQIDYLIDSILQPNKTVKENFHSLVVATDDGRVMTGIQVRQTDRELLLRDADDLELAVPLESIVEQTQGVSLMPLGQSDALTRGELIDLLRFLSELGKIGPYAVNKARLVRRWEVLQPTEDGLFRLRRTSFKTATTDDESLNWKSAYSMVSGDLPLDALPRCEIRNRPTPAAFARCYFEVSTAGEAAIRLNATDGLTAWLDGDPLNLAEATPLKLTSGRHRLTFAVDLDARQQPLRCELDDAGATARVQIVNGK